jgi:hypothetical protein
VTRAYLEIRDNPPWFGICFEDGLSMRDQRLLHQTWDRRDMIECAESLLADRGW